MSAKKIGKVQSKRKLETRIINKKLPYIEILLIVVILLLFTTAHYLLTIAYLSDGMVWMGIYMDNLIVDIILYSAILLSFILLILIINRNFTLKKKK